jgi:hypothetical protein
MGCQLSVEQGVYLAVSELGLEEEDLQEWRLKDNHIECLGLVGKSYMIDCLRKIVRNPCACHFRGQCKLCIFIKGLILAIYMKISDKEISGIYGGPGCILCTKVRRYPA